MQIENIHLLHLLLDDSKKLTIAVIDNFIEDADEEVKKGFETNSSIIKRCRSYYNS